MATNQKFFKTNFVATKKVNCDQMKKVVLIDEELRHDQIKKVVVITY